MEANTEIKAEIENIGKDDIPMKKDGDSENPEEQPLFKTVEINPKELDLELILVDINAKVCEAFSKSFEGLPNVTIVNDKFENLKHYDCMVSAANSFGLMDGGVDAAITSFFGDQLMKRVQGVILEKYLGEQPIGTAFIIETKGKRGKLFLFLAHTPTMRVPQSIVDTDNVYNAMWAMLLAVRKHNKKSEKKIKTIACPGLGTFFGKMPPYLAADMMALAWKRFMSPPNRINWNYASDRQEDLDALREDPKDREANAKFDKWLKEDLKRTQPHKVTFL